MRGRPRVLIAGGGLGGLAAALALLRMGCEVEVYEQAPELKEMGAGLQLAANGTHVLYALGVGEELKALSCEAESKEIRIWNTGETWKLHDLGRVSIERYGYPYFTVYRPDLLGVLERAVRREKPDAIRLGEKCIGFHQNEEKTTLQLGSGATVEGDVLIGATGRNSPASSPGAASCRWKSCPSTWCAWWGRTGSDPAATWCTTRCAREG
jgi:salicylate hydroxylase